MFTEVVEVPGLTLLSGSLSTPAVLSLARRVAIVARCRVGISCRWQPRPMSRYSALDLGASGWHQLLLGTDGLPAGTTSLYDLRRLPSKTPLISEKTPGGVKVMAYDVCIITSLVSLEHVCQVTASGLVFEHAGHC